MSSSHLESSGYVIIPKIVEINRSNLLTAAQILKENSLISPRDAIHIAVMKNNKINLICSTDSHFDKIEGIKRKDPLAYSLEMT